MVAQIRTYFSALSLLITFLFLSSCSYLGPSGPSSTGLPDLTPQQKAQLSFEKVQQTVFVKSCTGCHGTSGGINLENYQNVKNNLAAIERSVFKTMTMPKGQILTQEQLVTLKAWIQMGAPEKAGAGNPTPTPEPTPTATPEELEATFSSIREKILVKRCIFCHSGNGSAKHIPLSTLEDLIDSPREIVLPGNADESGIVLAIERSDDKRMPPRTSGSALSSEEIRVIREWITNGASD